MFFQVSGKLPRGKLPPDNCSPSNCPLDDCPRIISPRTIIPYDNHPSRKIPPWAIAPWWFSPELFSIYFLLDNCSQQILTPLLPRAFPPCLTPPGLLTPTINASRVIVTNLLKKPQACHCQVCYSFLFTHWIPKRIFIRSKFR